MPQRKYIGVLAFNRADYEQWLKENPVDSQRLVPFYIGNADKLIGMELEELREAPKFWKRIDAASLRREAKNRLRSNPCPPLTNTRESNLKK